MTMPPELVTSSNASEYRLISAYENYPHREEGLDARSWLNFTERVILNDNNNLWEYDAKNETLNVLHEATSSIDTFEILAGKNIFLSTFSSTLTTISSLDRHGNTTKYNYTTIFEESRVRPKSLAFDRIGENLYIVDESKGTLIVINVNTREYNVLLADLIQPSKILLDSSAGVMFILQNLNSIIRADMSGENLNVIVEKSGISALALDCSGERVYWVNDVVGIESSDYDGKNLRYFHTDTATIIDISAWNKRLYWLWQDHHRMSKHQLVFCRTDDDICVDYLMQPLNSLENPTSIKVIAEKDKQSNQSTANPCNIGGGECEQLCLLVPRGRRSCACKLGWQLNPDKRTCRETRDFILYATDSTVRGRTLDVTRKILTDVILPTPYRVESLKSSIIFDYDYRHDVLYFSDGKNIFKTNLKGYRNQTTLLEYNENVITDLVYDWLSGNLYASEYEDQQIYYYTEGIKHYIKVFDVKHDTITRHVQLRSFTNGYSRRSSLCIYPNQHYIFYIATLLYTQSIYRLSTTSNSSIPFATLQDAIAHLSRPTAIDYSENRVYWICISDQTTRIDHANFDGNDVRSILVHGVSDPTFIFVYREWIFLANSNTIWRVKKKDGKNVVTVLSRQSSDRNTIYDVRLISDAVQSIS
ncbi:low-density lipoprotein receptor-related protein 1B-like isoform X2 [Phymastichus coffea]|nr:low-density lipoprotein receptor-related protein 1B-like isoform X2 [Phymastichus coffea]